MSKPKPNRSRATCHPDKPKVTAAGDCPTCYKRIYNKKNKDKVRAQSDKWRANNKEQIQERRFMARYGITVQQYNDRLEAQNSRCAICRELPEKVRLHVDHDHETGLIRGLLCGRCNRVLGLLHDDPDLCSTVKDYLMGIQWKREGITLTPEKPFTASPGWLVH